MAGRLLLIAMVSGIIFALIVGPGIRSRRDLYMIRSYGDDRLNDNNGPFRDVNNMAGINLLSSEIVYDTKIMKNFPHGKS